MNTKLLIIALLFLITSINAFVQKLTVTGRLIDQKNSSIDTAEALLLANNNFIACELTTETGDFTLKNLASGNCILLIRKLGDTLYVQTFQLTQNVDLDTFTAKYSPNFLQEVTSIIEKCSVVENKRNRFVFNISNSIFEAETNNTEIIKTINKHLRLLGKNNFERNSHSDKK